MINMDYLNPEQAAKLIIEYLNLREDNELRKPYKG